MVNHMPSRRLDFKALRASANFENVLASYGIALEKDGSNLAQHKALCPFHDDQKPSLKVNTEKNIYHCFVCDAGGNILEFVMAMDGIAIREAARKVAELSGSTVDRQAPPPPATPETPGVTADDLPTENQPLSFALKLEQDPELSAWLSSRGIEAPAIERFGLGRVSARSKTIGGRLAIPLHDEAGQLIGYCGRYVGDDVPDDVPKYLMPKRFRKELAVFNLHRYRANPPPHRFTVLVESFLSVIRHDGHLSALSTMGRSISPEQIALLRETGITRILVVFDGDEPGRAGARAVSAELAPHFWTRIVDLPEGVKPHHLAWDAFRPFLADAWQTRSSTN